MEDIYVNDILSALQEMKEETNSNEDDITLGWAITAIEHSIKMQDEIVTLKAELKQLEKSDASKEQSSIDYYGLYRELKTENKALKERLYKSFELRLELNQNFWRVCGETGRAVEFMVVQINLYPDEIRYIDDSYNDFSVDELGETIFLTKAEAEARLKELKGEK